VRLARPESTKSKRRELRERKQSQEEPGMYRGADASMTPLDNLLSELDEQLLGKERRRRTAKVEQYRQAALDLQKLCYTARYDATTVAGAYENQHMQPAIRRLREATRRGGPPLARTWAEGALPADSL
jgi:hypothetical protein